jgi:hypothetical protein
MGSYDLFSGYHAVQAELRRKVNAKQYVAMIVKEAKTKTGGKKYYPVHVAQVKDVLPTLSPASFCPDYDVPTVCSRFTIHNNTEEIWFCAPVVDLNRENITKSLIDCDESWTEVVPTNSEERA